jgi:hypothetical protein
MSFFKKIAKEFEELGIGGKDKDKDKKEEESSHGYGGDEGHHGSEGHHCSEGYRGGGHEGGGYGGKYQSACSQSLTDMPCSSPSPSPVRL